MCVRGGVSVELEELPQVISGEVPLHVFFLIHHTTTQSFLVRLTLEHLLFNTSCLLQRQTSERGMEGEEDEVDDKGYCVITQYQGFLNRI